MVGRDGIFESKAFLLVFLIMAFTSCATDGYFTDFIYDNKRTIPILGTHEDFIPYQVWFSKEYGRDISYIPIHYGVFFTGETIGYCTTYWNGYREITINKSYWDSVGENYRKVLIAHELGHCALNLGHNDQKDDNGVPFSIMNTYVSNDLVRAFEDDPDLYMDRLFGR